MLFLVSTRFWTLLFAGVWSLIWIAGASQFVLFNNYDAIFILGIFSTPSSLIVSGLSGGLAQLLGLSNGTRLFIDLSGFLPFGAAQFGAVGYAVGRVAQWVYQRKGAAS
jgi:hypothetical protein